MNGYTPKQQEYISSVDGNAHMSAVDIIGDLEARHNELREAVILLRKLEKVCPLPGRGAEHHYATESARAEVDRLINDGGE